MDHAAGEGPLDVAMTSTFEQFLGKDAMSAGQESKEAEFAPEVAEEPKDKGYVLMLSPGKKYHLEMQKNKEAGAVQAESELKARHAYLANKDGVEVDLAHMSKEERHQEILNLHKQWLGEPKVDPAEKERLDRFVEKLRREWQYPIETLEALIMQSSGSVGNKAGKGTQDKGMVGYNSVNWSIDEIVGEIQRLKAEADTKASKEQGDDQRRKKDTDVEAEPVNVANTAVTTGGLCLIKEAYKQETADASNKTGRGSRDPRELLIKAMATAKSYAPRDPAQLRGGIE
jgi:hypothetical protein